LNVQVPGVVDQGGKRPLCEALENAQAGIAGNPEERADSIQSQSTPYF
jgi:hypothetical protein